MFSKKQRLKTSEFDEVFNAGEKVFTPLFILKYKENKLSFPRFGFSFPQKTFKTSVERHSLKRKISIILSKSKLNLLSKDFIFIFNKDIRPLDKDKLNLLINNLRIK